MNINNCTPRIILNFFLLIFIFNGYSQDVSIDFTGTNNKKNIILDSVSIKKPNSEEWITIKNLFNYRLNKDSYSFSNEFKNNSFLAFPNPSKEDIKIKFIAENRGNVSVNVINISGASIIKYQSELEKGIHTFNFTPPGSGIFIVAINADEKVSTLKVISDKSGVDVSKFEHAAHESFTVNDEEKLKNEKYECIGYYNGLSDVIFDSFLTTRSLNFNFSKSSFSKKTISSGNGTFKLDFNGDGKEDIMKFWGENEQFTADVHLSGEKSYNYQRWANNQGGFWEEMKWFLGDFNGDGKTDLMKVWNDDGQLTSDVHISNGSSFNIQRWATKQGGYSHAMKWFLGDFNGDGKTDVMKLWDDGGTFTCDVHISDGSSFNIQRWATKQGGYSNEMKWFVGDFNGDGKTDILKIWEEAGQFNSDVHISNGSSFNIQRWATKQGGYWDEQKWFVGDFNGDYKTDLMKLWNDEGQLTSDVHLSSGSSFSIGRWATKQGGYSNTMKFFAGDFNGDGKTDMMKLWNDDAQFTADVHISSGGSFAIQRWATKQGGYWDDQRWNVGDFNGDGKTDLMKFWNDGGQFSSDVHLSSGNAFNIERWSTKQGGYWYAQKWKTPDGYEFSPARTSNMDHLYAEIFQNVIKEASSVMVANLGYGLKIDNTYSVTNVRWYGADKLINYALPIYDTNTGSLTGYIYNYNFNGPKWTFVANPEKNTLADVKNVDLLFGILNKSIHPRDLTEGRFKFSAVRVIRKGKGQIVVDENGTQVLENSAVFAASVSNPITRITSNDSNGNSITIDSKKVFYNGQSINFAETTRCFVKGTLVHTNKGLVSIDKIKKGDKVLAFNTETGKTDFKAVNKTFKNKTKRLVKLVLSGETIRSTEEHPFLTVNNEWVAAAKLEIGQKIASGTGETVVVESIAFEDKECDVYNLEIIDYNTYCIGKKAIVVHNDCVVQNWVQKNVQVKVEGIAGGGGYVVLKPNFNINGCNCSTVPTIDIVEIGGLAGLGGAVKFDLGVLSLDAELGANYGASIKLEGNKPISQDHFGKIEAAVSSLAGLGFELRRELTLDGSAGSIGIGSEISLFGIVGETIIKSNWDSDGNTFNTFDQKIYYKIPFTNLEWKPGEGWNLNVNGGKIFGR